MIIMDVRIDNFYCFRNFHINMSYPKRIVGTTIAHEYLEDRPNFRYKKVNILMGSNATGKTTLGKMLMMFANCFGDENYKRFKKAITDESREALLRVDFVSEMNKMYRFDLSIQPKSMQENSDDIKVSLASVEIGNRDSYETCARKLDNNQGEEEEIDKIDTGGWSFSYAEDAWKAQGYDAIEDKSEYLLILEKLLKTLDPSIEKVIRVDEVENTYAIRLLGKSILIQNGKILDDKMLSSGTKAGLEIAYVMASLICNMHHLYYCDELFSYVNGDIEKACLSILIARLEGRKQLFFTTHNIDILDMQLPKHSFVFLKKDKNNRETPITCVYASDYLKRNTDSLKHAAENDLFSTAPEMEKLYEILDL